MVARPLCFASVTHRALILALTAANFVVGFSVLIVPGMLTSLAAGQGVSIPAAGWLITLGSIVMGLGAPLIAATTSAIDRRQLLVAGLALFVAGHLVCALTNNFTALLIARAVTLISAAIVTPQAAATIALVIPGAGRGAAVAAIFVGWSIASVVAMPVANVLAAQFSWRVPFVVAAVLAFVVAIWVSRATPKKLTVPALSLHSWIQVAKHPILVPVLLVTLIGMAGQFVLFSFMVATLEKGLGFTGWVVPAILLFYGVFGVIGNAMAVKLLPRFGADTIVIVALFSIALGALFWALALVAGPTRPLTALALLGVGNVLWGLGGFSANSSQQGRLMAAQPALASASVALNTSFLYLGQAIGTPLGAAVIATDGYTGLPWITLVFMLAAALLSWRISKYQP